MRSAFPFANYVVAAAFACLTYTLPAAGQGSDVNSLLDQLSRPGLDGWESVEGQILTAWSHSGSASMDLLLERGRQALDEGRPQDAVQHFSALIDHAPDFAEAWNARASAYFQLGRFGLAIGDIRHVLALNPRHFGALTGLGLILEEMKDNKDALAAYRAARAIHPNRPDLKEAVERLEPQVEGTEL